MDRNQKLAGLLGNPQATQGLFGAATVNPLMARQFAAQRQNMAPPTSVMDERYPAWKKAQDQADVFLLGADAVGAVAPLVKPAITGAGLLGKALAPKAADMAEGYMARTGLLQPATVWHGSPHKFDAFDASKIGTGEGAQAYGHGLYLAENPAVAKQYAENLAQPSLKFGDGTKVLAQQIPRGNLARTLNAPDDPVMNTAANVLQATNGDFAAAIKRLDSFDDAEAIDLIKHWQKNPSQAPITDAGKNLYKVDLPDEHIAKMLDWDKPLSQQSAEVRGALDLLIKRGVISTEDAGIIRQYDSPGSVITKMLSNSATGKDVNAAYPGSVQASNILREQGIPGIRYLDGGSRAGGQGTSNFVVFPGNEGLLKILERQ